MCVCPLFSLVLSFSLLLLQVDTSGSGQGEVIMESTSPTGELRYLTSVRDGQVVAATIQPKEVGTLFERICRDNFCRDGIV